MKQRSIFYAISIAVFLALLGSRIGAQNNTVVGNITSIESAWQQNTWGDTLIVSKVHIGRNTEVDVVGGTVGDTTLAVSSQSPLAVGDSVVVVTDEHGHQSIKKVGSAGFTTTGHTWAVNQVRYVINPDNFYVTAAQAISAIQFAANDWNVQSGADIVFAYGGTTSGGSLTLDHINNVFFRNDASGYIAETYWWWDGTGHLVDADIVYHENFGHCSHETGCNGGYFIENTGTHEFGHMLGLNHSTDPTATMYATEGACEMDKETLAPDDIAGIQALYPFNSNPGPSPKPCHGKKCR